MSTRPRSGVIRRNRPRKVAGSLRRWLHAEEWREEKELLVSVGENTYRGGDFEIHAWDELAKCRIGKFCSIADHVHIFLGGNHRYDWVTTYPIASQPTASNLAGTRLGISPNSNGDIVVGNDVWIGSNASIMSGLTVGNGAVIAAFSHVVKDVEPYEIVGGNPARHISFRFDPETISRLIAIEWWDWPVDTIVKNEALLTGPPSPDDLSKMEEVSRRNASDSGR